MDIEEARAKHYILLSRLLTDQTRAPDVQEYIAFGKSISGGLYQVIEPFVEMLENRAGKPQLDHELRVEYAHLFLLPEGVKPYESVYLGQKAILMQESWISVKKFYRDSGWALDRTAKRHPEDHISVELAFMAHLIENGGQEAREELFYRQHLSAWAPQLFEDIMKNKYAAFYKEVASYGQSFFHAEQSYFAL